MPAGIVERKRLFNLRIVLDRLQLQPNLKGVEYLIVRQNLLTYRRKSKSVLAS